MASIPAFLPSTLTVLTVLRKGGGRGTGSVSWPEVSSLGSKATLDKGQGPLRLLFPTTSGFVVQGLLTKYLLYHNHLEHKMGTSDDIWTVTMIMMVESKSLRYRTDLAYQYIICRF